MDAFISPTATVVGRVNIQDRSSVGYGCVLRGDTNYIHVGAYSHILDGTSIQVKLDKNGAPGGTVIGNYATIGADWGGGVASGPAAVCACACACACVCVCVCVCVCDQGSASSTPTFIDSG